MSPEKQRIAIAETCGYIWVKAHANNFRQLSLSRDPRYLATGLESIYEDGCDLVPDYLRDLNAMHEAEELLYDIPGGMSLYTDLLEGGFRATAAQRCEAFLRTIGKWEDAP